MIGVTNLQGLSAPATGSVQQSESERSINVEEEPDENGNTVYVVPHKYVTRRVRISGVGDAELASIAAGVISKGTVSVIRRKQSESTSGIPRFDIGGIAFEDRVDPS